MKSKIILLIIAVIGCTAATWAQRQKPVAAQIMTFNIRTENMGDGRNNWEMRYQKVGSFIKKSKADIIGMQEVRHRQLVDLANQLPGYSYVGVARDDGKQAGEYNPIFFNKNRYTLLRSGTFWLSPTPSEPSYGWGAACRRIATWAILQEQTTKKSIIVLNTHLDHVSQEARINGATLIKERLSRMNNELPVVITGDMNVEETNPAYTKLLTAIFPMQDACKAVKKVKGPSYTFQGFGQLPAEKYTKIDYIFLSSQVQIKRAAIHSAALGKGYFLSDHNALSTHIVY